VSQLEEASNIPTAPDAGSEDERFPIIPERIRSIRNKRKKGLTSVSTHIGMDQGNYSNAELGNRPFPVKKVIPLVLELETSIDYLCGLTDDDRPYPRSEAYRDSKSTLP